MKQTCIFIISLIILSSCSRGWDYKNNVIIDETNHILSMDTTPQIEIKYGESDELEDALLAAKFIETIVNENLSAYTTEIEIINIDLISEPDFYDLLFMVGDYYFADYKNQALVYAIINLEWKKIVENSLDNNDIFSIIIKKEEYNIIRLPEFKALFESHELKPSEINQVAQYINNYLLNDILFVSVQELQERDYRYFSNVDMNTYFMQGVLLIEMTEFAGFVQNKYGTAKLSALAQAEYNDKNWIDIIGEGIYEVESAFADKVEATVFKDIFIDEEFLSELDDLLKLYNTTTKDTLYGRTTE